MKEKTKRTIRFYTVWVLSISLLAALIIKNYLDIQKFELLISNLTSEYTQNTSKRISDLEERIIYLEIQNSSIIVLLDENKESYNLSLKESDSNIGKEIEKIRSIVNNSAGQSAEEVPLEKIFKEGFILFNGKKYIESLEIFSEALSIYPKEKKLKYHYLVSLYYSDPLKRNNYSFLKEQFELLKNDRQYEEKSLIILAEISLAEDDLEKAAYIYTELYKKDKTNYEYLRILGMIEYQLNNCDTASDYFRSYLDFNSEDYEIIYFYGLALFGQGDYRQALTQFYSSLQSEKLFGNVDRKIKETIDMINKSSDKEGGSL